MAEGDRRSRDAEFAEFMAVAQPGLLRTARYLTGSDDQAVYVRVKASWVSSRAWSRVRPEGALAYTRQVMVNHRRSAWRRSGREVSRAPGDVLLDAVTHQDGRTELRDEVVRLLRSLPRRQRAVVVLRYYVDLSEGEVAHLMGISTGTVKSAAARGLAALRHLATEGEGTIL
jgi:RNA polymerase sigma-70 factor (sigma-E family)